MVAFSAVIPLMTVVNYSFQDIMGPNQRVFVGWEWFREVLQNRELHQAFLRQMLFSFLVLFVQIPLGVGVALL
ncbi:MAG: sugar ABC transporter permease, partial [Bdellovibrionota bacterium]|nr:sugar ABC transporter permease [Bdellovibrionota bacterium]